MIGGGVAHRAGYSEGGLFYSIYHNLNPIGWRREVEARLYTKNHWFYAKYATDSGVSPPPNKKLCKIKLDQILKPSQKIVSRIPKAVNLFVCCLFSTVSCYWMLSWCILYSDWPDNYSKLFPEAADAIYPVFRATITTLPEQIHLSLG